MLRIRKFGLFRCGYDRRAFSCRASNRYADASHTQIRPFPLWRGPLRAASPLLRNLPSASLRRITTPALLTLFYSHWLPF